MATLKQTLSVDGRVLSNNDPDLVIKLDSHPAVQISKIEPDSITYGFTGLVTPDAVYKLNLTFTYKGTLTKVVALELTHIASVLTAKEVGSTKLVTGENNNVYFEVKDQNGNPITGLKMDGSLGAKTQPPYGTIESSSGNFYPDEDNPGRYYFKAAVGPKAGTLTADIKVLKDTFKATLNKLTWTFDESPIATVSVPVKVSVGEETSIEVTFTQKRSTGPSVPVVGTITATSGTGTLTITSPFAPKEGTPGTYVGKVKATVPTDKNVLNFTIVEDWTGGGNLVTWDKLSVSLLSENLPIIATVDPNKIYNMDGQQSVKVKLTQGGVPIDGTLTSLDVTGTATVNETPPLQVSGGEVYLTLTPTGDIGNITIAGSVTDRNSLNLGNFSVDLESAQTPSLTVEYGQYHGLVMGTDYTVIFKPTVNHQPGAKLVTIDIPSSDIPSNVTIVSQKALNDTDYEVVFRPGAVGSVSGSLNMIITGTPVDGVIGRTRQSLDLGMQVDPLLKPITVNVSTNPLKGKYGETVTLGMSLSQGGQTLPLTNGNLIYTFEPAGYLEFVTAQPTGIVVELIKDPNLEMVPTQMKVNVSDGTDNGQGSFLLETLTAKEKPKLTVTREINAKLFDEGILPLMVESEGVDLMEKATTWLSKTGSFVAIDSEGKWRVFNANTNASSETLQTGFTITHNGVAWVYTAQVKFNIEASADNNIFKVSHHPEFIIAGQGEETTYTVYPTLFDRPIPNNVDVEFSGASATNITLVKTSVSPSGKGLDVTYRGNAPIDDVTVQVVYKLKDTPGTTEGTDKVTAPPVKMYVFAAGKLRIAPGSVKGNKLSGPADTEELMTFELYLGAQRIPINDSRVRSSIGGVGARIGLISGENVGWRLNGEVGKYFPTYVIELKDDTANRDTINMEADITTGTAIRKAIWYPEGVEELPPSSDVQLSGVVSTYAGSSVRANTNSNVILENTPANGNAGDALMNSLGSTGSMYTTGTFRTGHTGESFIVKSKLTETSTGTVFDQQSRVIYVKQGVWDMMPAGTVDASVRGKITTIEFAAVMTRYMNDPHHLTDGEITKIKVEGEALNYGQIVNKGSGVWSIPIASTGNVGDIIVTGVIIEQGITYPFRMVINSKKPNNKLKISNVDKSVTVNHGATKTVNFKLDYNGAALPTTTEGIKAYINKAGVTIAGFDASGIKLKFDTYLDSEFNHYDLSLTITYGGESVTLATEVWEMYTGEKPKITVLGPVDAKLGDKGQLPIKLTYKGEDVLSSVTAYKFTNSSYVTLNQATGEWEVTTQKPTAEPEVLELRLNLQLDGIKFVPTASITFNISDPNEPVFTLTENPIKMKLWETREIPFKIEVQGVDVSDSITDIILTSKTDISEMFEFVKMGDKKWGFKSIKSDPVSNLLTTAWVDFKFHTNDKDYVLNRAVKLQTLPNDGEIPTERFNVDIL